jgi:hypothetical protein
MRSASTPVLTRPPWSAISRSKARTKLTEPPLTTGNPTACSDPAIASA